MRVGLPPRSCCWISAPESARTRMTKMSCGAEGAEGVSAGGDGGVRGGCHTCMRRRKSWRILRSGGMAVCVSFFFSYFLSYFPSLQASIDGASRSKIRPSIYGPQHSGHHEVRPMSPGEVRTIHSYITPSPDVDTGHIQDVILAEDHRPSESYCLSNPI